MRPAPATSPSGADVPGAASAPLRVDHDRFVTLAFCWADAVIEIDRALRISHASGLTMAIVGQDPDQLAGQAVEDLLAPSHRTELRSLVAIARDCGRVDNVSLTFAAPDHGEVAVDLALHVLPDDPDHAFLAINKAGADLSAGQPQGDTVVVDEGAFIAAALQRLSQANGGGALTLLAIPELVGLRGRVDQRAYRNLTNTISGYLSGHALDRRVAAIGDGRYGLVHDRGLDIGLLEMRIPSMIAGFAGKDIEAGVETARIIANEALSADTLGQVIVHAVRRFRDADDTGAALRHLREDLPAVAAEAMQMAETFKGLVESKGFHIAFQPVVASDGGTILFFEGLARIDDRPDESPYGYISYAEETGQICRFDLAMAEKAMSWLKERNRNDIRLSVNISSLSLLDPDCASQLHRILDANPECAGQLAIEITGCFRIADLDAIDIPIQSLRRRGNLVGLDDFSAGIDGFRMLTALDVDFVKFRSQTSAAAADSLKVRALLEALTGFCRQIGVRTVATRVETVPCLALLRGCGIEFVQGYLLGKPSPEIGSFR